VWPPRATIRGLDGSPKPHRYYLVGSGKSRWLGRGRINVVSGTDFHRVELPGARPAWTLFVHGPKVRRWGFLDLVTRAFEFWRPESA
jgi:hypothetical protein